MELYESSYSVARSEERALPAASTGLTETPLPYSRRKSAFFILLDNWETVVGLLDTPTKSQEFSGALKFLMEYRQPLALGHFSFCF